MKTDLPFLIFGHRGSSRRAPENTLSAFVLLVEEGIEAVELDVHQCKSGEIVVAHDDDLLRTAGKNWRIRRTDLATLKSVDVGRWFSDRYAGEKVPLLSEVFAALGPKFTYDIEIKHYGWESKPGSPEREILRVITEYSLGDRCIVSSFDPLVLRRFERLGSGIPTALIYGERTRMPFPLRRGRGRALCRPSVLKPHWREVSARMLDREHKKGNRVIPWTVDDPDHAQELCLFGVDGIISNVPGEIRAAVKSG